MTSSKRIAYFRVSTSDQSIESQRAAMGGDFAMEFNDEGVSGAVPAAKRPGFAAMLHGLTKGATVHVYAVDRLGRDAIDVQTTVRKLLGIGVSVHVHGLGLISRGAGELILAVLAQVADMERQKIIERTEAGRNAARQSLALTGLTHRGKTGLGRPAKADAQQVAAWRKENSASLTATAAHWSLSLATVKRYCAASGLIGRQGVPMKQRRASSGTVVAVPIVADESVARMQPADMQDVQPGSGDVAVRPPSDSPKVRKTWREVFEQASVATKPRSS